MHAIITWFFSRVWNYIISQDQEKKCICLNGWYWSLQDGGQRDSAQLTGIFMQRLISKTSLSPTKYIERHFTSFPEAKKIPWMTLALKNSHSALCWTKDIADWTTAWIWWLVSLLAEIEVLKIFLISHTELRGKSGRESRREIRALNLVGGCWMGREFHPRSLACLYLSLFPLFCILWLCLSNFLV